MPSHDDDSLPSPNYLSGCRSPRHCIVFYLFHTRKGKIGIVPCGDRWHVIYNNQDLGSYPSAHSAVSGAAGGHGLSSPSNGVDLATLGIPVDLSRWFID